jgi:hypothetical protein
MLKDTINKLAGMMSRPIFAARSGDCLGVQNE